MYPRLIANKLALFSKACSTARIVTFPGHNLVATMASQASNRKINDRFDHLPLSTSGPQKTTLTVSDAPWDKRFIANLHGQGNALLRTPYFNKGTAFTAEERATFKLHGLIPDNVQTLDEQVRRAYEQFKSRPSDIAKNTFMTSLKEQNE